MPQGTAQPFARPIGSDIQQAYSMGVPSSNREYLLISWTLYALVT
jgi:hypothetical protein